MLVPDRLEPQVRGAGLPAPPRACCLPFPWSSHPHWLWQAGRLKPSTCLLTTPQVPRSHLSPLVPGLVSLRPLKRVGAAADLPHFDSSGLMAS